MVTQCINKPVTCVPPLGSRSQPAQTQHFSHMKFFFLSRRQQLFFLVNDPPKKKKTLDHPLKKKKKLLPDGKLVCPFRQLFKRSKDSFRVGGGGRKNETLPKRVISFIFDT